MKSPFTGYLRTGSIQKFIYMIYFTLTAGKFCRTSPLVRSDGLGNAVIAPIMKTVH